MKKRIITATLATVLLVGALSSCQRAEEDVNPPTDEQVETNLPSDSETEGCSSADRTLLKYSQALALLAQGNVEEAYDVFLTIKEYRNVSEYLSCFSFRYDTKVVRSSYSENTVYYEYDEYGKITLEVWESSRNNSKYSYTYEYDDRENLIRQAYDTEKIDEQVTLYEYDKNNRPIRQTNSDGFVTELEYDENGNIVKRVDENQTVEHTYDSNGNILTSTSESNGVIDLRHIHEYDAQGNRIKVTVEYDFGGGNKGSTVTTTQYDEKGKMIKQSTEQSNGISYYTDYEYDQNGNRIKDATYYSYISHEEFVIFTWEYDENGNATKQCRETEKGLDYSILYEYDSAGNCIQETCLYHKNGQKEVTTYEYDTYGNLLKMIAPGETDASDDVYVTTYTGYKLYYNPHPVRELPFEFIGKG